jgi:hypothetical protein
MKLFFMVIHELSVALGLERLRVSAIARGGQFRWLL